MKNSYKNTYIFNSTKKKKKLYIKNNYKRIIKKKKTENNLLIKAIRKPIKIYENKRKMSLYILLYMSLCILTCIFFKIEINSFYRKILIFIYCSV